MVIGPIGNESDADQLFEQVQRLGLACDAATDRAEKAEARVADLERTAACAEDMRDRSDARVRELEIVLRSVSATAEAFLAASPSVSVTGQTTDGEDAQRQVDEIMRENTPIATTRARLDPTMMTRARKLAEFFGYEPEHESDDDRKHLATLADAMAATRVEAIEECAKALGEYADERGGPGYSADEYATALACISVVRQIKGAE